MKAINDTHLAESIAVIVSTGAPPLTRARERAPPSA